ncbi:MAG: glycosyltransferase [Bacteroidota bacterium]
MKVLHTIAQFRMGGAQTMLLDIVAELRQQGVDAVVVCLSKDNDLEEITDELPWFRTIPAALQLSIWRKPTYKIAALKKFIHAFQPDVIHSHLFEAELITRAVGYREAVYFSHCHDNMPPYRKLGLTSFFSKDLLLRYFERAQLFNMYRTLGGNQFVSISSDTTQYFTKPLPGTPDFSSQPDYPH